MRPLALAASLAACASPYVAPGDAPACAPQEVDHPVADALQAVLEERVARGLPGLALVLDDGRGWFAGAAGVADRRADTPLDSCHLFRVASVSKTFTAALAVDLAARGAVDLDAPVAGLLDEDDVARVDHAATATLRGLLQHTAGVRDYVDNPSFGAAVATRPHEVRTRDRLVRYAWPLRGRYAPGQGWGYANTGYELAADALEAATGAPLQALLEDDLLPRAGLERAFFRELDELPEPTARSYLGGLDVSRWDRSGERAATDVVTSVVDLHRFGRALFGGDLLGMDGLDTLQAWHELGGSDAAGLGLFRQEYGGVTHVTHTGGIPGFVTRLAWLPALDVVVAWSANGSGGRVYEALDGIEAELVEVLRAP